MSFKAVQAVIDSWQKAGHMGSHPRLAARRTEWTLLLWIARNSDNNSLTCMRSQLRLADELGRSVSSVEKLIKNWRVHGVLKLRTRGGGRERKPNIYAIDLVALMVYTERCEHEKRVATPAPSAMRENGSAELHPHHCNAGDTPSTPAPSAMRENWSENSTAGVGPQLPQSEPVSVAKLPHSSSVASSDLSESDLSRTDMARAKRSRVSPIFNRQGDPEVRAEAERADIEKMLAKGLEPDLVAKQLFSRYGTTPERVQQFNTARRTA